MVTSWLHCDHSKYLLCLFDAYLLNKIINAVSAIFFKCVTITSYFDSSEKSQTMYITLYKSHNTATESCHFAYVFPLALQYVRLVKAREEPAGAP